MAEKSIQEDYGMACFWDGEVTVAYTFSFLLYFTVELHLLNVLTLLYSIPSLYLCRPYFGHDQKRCHRSLLATFFSF